MALKELKKELNQMDKTEIIKLISDVGFPKNRTVVNSNLLILNSHFHNEKQQI